jgi:DNA-binding CsgD family transcriptional regulator
MEFQREQFVEREIEIANYLLQKMPLNQIAIKTGISKKHVMAHIRNMMTKSKIKNIESLIEFLKSIEK